ncbi:acyl-CoA dehydrogenase [Parvibium lacunae]|uniref:3-methylmercaptopropionyl-CoA dehydrogenase n=1 Tax=Parvibium lacunae TaxID=1888893 RepID=A0A368L4Y6_9BURK|nr:acyl-CoA dehydrogenase [Parvibium lacunae]RCS58492.1 acyl-CoA dehydrogenase [Parvibium lacunae]
MTAYAAPVKDMLFVLNELADLNAINGLPGYGDATPDTVEAILEESAKFTGEVLAPQAREADKAPSFFAEGKVTTAKGYRAAFKQFAEGGWQGLQHPVEFGGQGLPKVVGTACNEMLNSADLSFALCPLLTDGAIEALMTAGSEEQRNRYLPQLINGEWTGTMNLTEPQAGSDLSLIRSKAVKQMDGTYRLSGQKIFITYGEHDLAENIIHFVLARTPDAPAGVKGISLFIVPKVLLNADGSLGARNAVQCVSIEHKLGIKSSPTCVLQYGGTTEQEGAVGYLLGEENRGLEYMFIMMNAARFAVGVQGLAVAERAYQQALQYAKDRIQSRPVDASLPAAGPIIHHPDVRRMLLLMRTQTEAARALAYVTASYADVAHHTVDTALAAEQQALYEYLVPIVKGWCTEMSVEVTSLGIQVHGGMGFIEETGAAQWYRDARILTIYEGTTAIQANDLVGRKTAKDGGAVAQLVLTRIQVTLTLLKAHPHPEAARLAKRLHEAQLALRDVVAFIVSHVKTDINAVFAGSVPYLKLAGLTLGGWQLARAWLAAQTQLQAGQGDAGFLQAKCQSALFFAEHLLPQTQALRTSIVDGAASVVALV